MRAHGARSWGMLTLVVVGVAACGSTNGQVAASDRVRVPEASGAAVTAVAPLVVPESAPPIVGEAPAAPAAAPAVPAVDGASLLAGALDVMAYGYHFSTTVTVDGAPVVTADGDHLIDGTRLTLAGPAGVLSYVITAQGSWVLPENGDWEQLATAPSSTDPLAALRSPTAVVVDAADGVSTMMTVTVPAVALGIPGDPAATAAVQVHLDASAAVHQVSYSTSVDGHPATVNALISPVIDTSPIAVPG